jgi:transcriptional regulator with XRE-family HTH domain
MELVLATEARELENLGLYLRAARLERKLSQPELASRCALSQAQVSYFEAGHRRPTLAQLFRIARALDVSTQKLIAGSDRPGTALREIAVELRNLGIADLWVKDVVVPCAFRRTEELIALVVSGEEPAPRLIEAIPAVLAWNEIDPILLQAYGHTGDPRTCRRLGWLADMALAIDRQRGFPGGCRKEPLARFTRMVSSLSSDKEAWDSLGRPMSKPPTSPLWKRWRINYDAALDEFTARAKELDELRNRPVTDQASSIARRISKTKQASSIARRRLKTRRLASARRRRMRGKG